MPTNLRSTIVFSLLLPACVSVTLPDEFGGDDHAGDTDGADEASEPDMLGETGELWTPVVGEMWGPCPTTDDGSIDLCLEPGTACVPTQDGHMCLPIGHCPSVVPIGSDSELGWGNACYPRCSSESECGLGMICDLSLNGEPMCAWQAG